MLVYSYNYDDSYVPSMPLIEVMLGRAYVSPTLRLRAIVDSGADATMIPVRYLKQIGARKGKQTLVRGYLGHRDLVDRYIISLEFAHYARSEILVVGVTQTAEFVIGRDVLNSLVVTLNGAASVVEILG